ncbi:MAG: aspartate/glutamate racemase family protein, partial [Litorivicinaceae bacterium]
MKILLINPNTTESMTRKAEIAAQKVARPDTQIIATNSKMGPSSIEGFYDVACCLPGLLKETSRFSAIDAVIV